MSEKETESQAESLAITYKKVFMSEEGQKVLNHLMQCFYLSGTFNADPHAMYFNEGQRAVINHILDNVDVDIERLREMRKSAITYDEFSI